MNYNILHGDCRELMATLDENSVDAIVTDPPYELGFMGKSWDASGVAFDPATWREALRVLKPGGHLIAFGGSRTYHRMAVAIEDAGFEIRDQIMWVYGSGFPKSHNISRGIDKAAGAEREVVGFTERGNSVNTDFMSGGNDITAPATAAAKQWDGWGTALKPAHEPMVLARKPVIGTVANNVLTYGVGGLNIDGARVGSEGGGTNCTNRDEFGKCIGHDNAGRSTSGATVHAAESNSGRWPANFIHDGSEEVVALFPDTKSGNVKPYQRANRDSYSGAMPAESTFNKEGDSGSAARFFYCAKASKRDRNEGLDGFEDKARPTMGDGIGGQPNQQVANNKNHHPTVKPTTLMQYLVRLVTPLGGVVLDPFLGSGSTGKACAYEGFDFIGMEVTYEYIPIATARIEFALAYKDEQLDL